MDAVEHATKVATVDGNYGGFFDPPWYRAGTLEVVEGVFPQALRLRDEHGGEAIYLKEMSNS